jgi:hypothetical protein
VVRRLQAALASPQKATLTTPRAGASPGVLRATIRLCSDEDAALAEIPRAIAVGALGSRMLLAPLAAAPQPGRRGADCRDDVPSIGSCHPRRDWPRASQPTARSSSPGSGRQVIVTTSFVLTHSVLASCVVDCNRRSQPLGCSQSPRPSQFVHRANIPPCLTDRSAVDREARAGWPPATPCGLLQYLLNETADRGRYPTFSRHSS